MKNNIKNIRKITVTGIMSAVAAVLMFLEFSVPIVPSFLKFDFSDLPAVITSFSLGPLWGVLVELLKNVIHLPFTQTSGVGELANFIIGALLVFPAGLIYKKKRTRGGAVIGSLAGALFAAAVSVPVNYFITYPFYTNFMPMDAIIGMYRAIVPAADTLIKALLIFNVPFTFVKGILCVLITFFVYKPLSRVIKGKNND
ncbi:MAG: ECF transporter S component [Clostridia bacterium]|nr:ECF transporter S component [Clostridia bacterium]